MRWYEHFTQDGVREIYELQLAGETLCDDSFEEEMRDITRAIREWLGIRKNRAADIYIIVRSIRKYHIPLIDYWNNLKETDLKVHSNSYKPLAGRIEIEDATNGTKQSYTFDTLEFAAKV